jgi:hypothetical protein
MAKKEVAQEAIIEPEAESPTATLQGEFKVLDVVFEINFEFPNLAGNMLASRLNKTDLTKELEDALKAKFGLYSVVSK